MSNLRAMNFERLHSMLIACACLILFTGLSVGLSPPPQFLVVALFVGVLLIGLPHGGLDHRVGQALLNGWGWSNSMAWFVIGYLLVSTAVIASWFVAPIAIILIFFTLSAWHFGLEEEGEVILSPLHSMAMFARGGMVIWVPCWLQADAVSSLLQTTIPLQHTIDIKLAVGVWGWLWPVWISLLIYDSFDKIEVTSKNRQSKQKMDLSLRWLRIGRSVSMFLLFAIADPLLSFVIYFCGWHSIRGLVHLYRDYGRSIRSFLSEIAPVSIVAIILFVGGWFLWKAEIGELQSSIRIVFLGLSAVAIPHLLLHVLVRTCPPPREQTPDTVLTGEF